MNPVIRRELLEVLRTRKAVALQLGLALAFALLVLLRWPTGEHADLSGARALQVLRVFGYALLAAVLMIVPAFPATSLVKEKVQGTLALLLNSPLRPWTIYLGKLAGVLGFAGVLLAMTLPAAAACHALGGTVVRGGVTALYVVLALAAVQVATLGLWVSSRSQTPDGALRATYALVLGVAFLTLVPHMLLLGTSGPAAVVASWLRALSPVPAVMTVLGHADAGAQGLSAGPDPVARYALLAGLMSVAFAVATVARLNHAMLDRARPPGVMTEDRSAGGQAVRRVLFVVDPQRRPEPIKTWVNPVMVKEFRSRRLGRSHWALRLVAATAILSLALSTLAAAGALGLGVEIIGAGLVLLQVALLLLFAPSLAGGIISGERESGSWQLLRMTPLSADSILRGKLLSVAWPLLLVLAATLPGYIVMMTVDPALVHRIARVVASLALTAVFAVLVSATVSSFFRSTAVALSVAYVVLLVVCVGTLLVWLGRDAPFGHATVQAALSLNPVAAALEAAEAPGFDGYALLPRTWWIIGSVCLALLLLLRVRVWQLYRPE